MSALHIQETRTPQQYRDEVQAYLEGLENSIRRVASARLARFGRAKLQLALLNVVDDNLEEVRLEVDFADEFFVAERVSREACDAPLSPRIWGPYTPGQGFADLGAPISHLVSRF
jgi:hypothetical protein